jgi:hypothetical protein
MPQRFLATDIWCNLHASSLLVRLIGKYIHSAYRVSCSNYCVAVGFSVFVG